MAAGKRRSGKQERSRRQQETVLLEAFFHALSDAEIQSVLARALLELDEAGRQRLIERLGPDTGERLCGVLESGRGRQQRPGKAKVRQDWDQASGDWQSSFRGVSKKHTPRYLDEFIYRFNRRWREGELFGLVLRRAVCGDPFPYSRLTAELFG